MSPTTAKLFMNGRSQAVRLPKEFRFQGKEVFIHRRGEDVILSPNPPSWRQFFEEVPLMPDDFLDERDNDEPQSREDIF